MPPPNESFFGRVDREPELNAAERFVRDLVFAHGQKSPRLLPTDFSHVPAAEARKDLQKGIELRKKFRFGGTTRGFLLEKLLLWQTEASNWFGPDTQVFSTTDIDDLTEGIDAVIEWSPEKEGGVVPRMAVDVTSSESPEGVGDKLAKLNKFNKVKYFRSEIEKDDEDEPTVSSLNRLPIVILGLDGELFGMLAKNMQDAKIASEKPDENGKKHPELYRRALAESPFKAMLLLQAQGQLQYQRNNPLAVLCLDQVQAEIEKIKDSPEYRKALVIGKSSFTHRKLTLPDHPRR